MGFSRRRGRPALQKEKTDLGTAELRFKKAFDITTEAIDLCLKKDLITQEQHQSAIRLRWLYTLKFGSPDISAYSLDGVGASCFRADDEAWLSARHYEYATALKELDLIRAKKIVMNISIFNMFPSFLQRRKLDINSSVLKQNQTQLLKFQEGLDILCDLFGKK